MAASADPVIIEVEDEIHFLHNDKQIDWARFHATVKAFRPGSTSAADQNTVKQVMNYKHVHIGQALFVLGLNPVHWLDSPLDGSVGLQTYVRAVTACLMFGDDKLFGQVMPYFPRRPQQLFSALQILMSLPPLTEIGGASVHDRTHQWQPQDDQLIEHILSISLLKILAREFKKLMDEKPSAEDLAAMFKHIDSDQILRGTPAPVRDKKRRQEPNMKEAEIPTIIRSESDTLCKRKRQDGDADDSDQHVVVRPVQGADGRVRAVAIKVKETTGNDQRVCAGSESHSMAGGVAMRVDYPNAEGNERVQAGTEEAVQDTVAPPVRHSSLARRGRVNVLTYARSALERYYQNGFFPSFSPSGGGC